VWLYNWSGVGGGYPPNLAYFRTAVGFAFYLSDTATLIAEFSPEYSLIRDVELPHFVHGGVGFAFRF
jgi:hypothetical protein